MASSLPLRLCLTNAGGIVILGGANGPQRPEKPALVRLPWSGLEWSAQPAAQPMRNTCTDAPHLLLRQSK